MKLQDLDDLAPPEPDADLLGRVHERAHRTRVRARRRRDAALAVTAIVLVLGVLGVVWQLQRAPDRRLSMTSPPSAPVEIAGKWKPVSVADYTGPIGNYRWRIAPFLRFDRGRWSGADGCNDLGGAYDLQDRGVFYATAEGGTTVQCDPPLFPTINVLQSATRVARGAKVLTFFDGDQVVATYKLVPNKSQSTDWAQDIKDVRASGEAAYVSQPIDIKRPGHYMLVFGPLSAEDRQRWTVDKGYGVSFADDQTFEGYPARERLEQFEQNGKLYFRMPLDVTAVQSEYDGFRVLLQY